MKEENEKKIDIPTKIEYEPGEKSAKKHPTSYIETLIHFVKAGIGAGIFSMAQAMSLVGYINGIILTIFLSFVCLYEQHVLLKCASNVRKHYGIEGRPDYGETFQLALLANDKWKKHARKMKIISNVFLILTQLGFCAVYFVFIGNTLKNVMEFFGYSFEVRILILFSLVPIWLSALITNLKFLAPCSLLASVCMITGISITFYYISQDLPPISERSMATFSLTGLALFFGTVIYLFEGIGLVLPLQAEMKEPKNFPRPFGVLNVGVIILTTLVISFGFMGYWQFGNEVAGSLILNLPPDEVFYQSVLVIVACGVALGYAIQFYIPIQILFPLIRRSIKLADNNPLISELLFRTIMVILTFLVAILVPNIGLLISLIGAVCSNSLALVFPVIIEYLVKTRGEDKMKPIHIVKNIFILLLAVIGFLSGGFEAIRGIIALYT
ncbi:hypothetical protein PVAND_013737 [Polypedilum vanderplanki]|uniref:Amino acid transporter transmembrane domain-containing protein n=1 Tax=Polypedilum vanderplanki TaxID=319348 RepID=A0A9J6CRJ1_POLVA|nr:hypothetical protein PVAND_013737 [Polypedilum vanderplanki]